MIRISAKAEYAARAVLHLTRQAQSKFPTQLTDISVAMNIPREFLIQVMSALAKAGIVRSRRGAHGGYVLAREPNQIFLKDVVEAIDGEIGEFRCEDSSFTQCIGQKVCSFRPIWEDLTRTLAQKMASINFQKLSCSDEIRKVGCTAKD